MRNIPFCYTLNISGINTNIILDPSITKVDHINTPTEPSRKKERKKESVTDLRIERQ